MQSKPFAPREINAHLLHQHAQSTHKTCRGGKKTSGFLVEALQRRQSTLTGPRGHLSRCHAKRRGGMLVGTGTPFHFPASEPEKRPAWTQRIVTRSGHSWSLVANCQLRHAATLPPRPAPPSSMRSQQSGETLARRRVSRKTDARTQACNHQSKAHVSCPARVFS